MANAGNHNDTRLLKRMIKEGKLIRVIPNDNLMMTKIKLRFNSVVANDQSLKYRHDGKNYITHSAFSELNKTLIWVNQVRLRYWCFESIKGELVNI